MPRLYKPGSLLRIPLADGSFGYGRVLKLPHDAYYDYRTDTPESDLDRIASMPILFKIAVRHMGERGWEVIGWRKLEEQFSQPIAQFMQDRRLDSKSHEGSCPTWTYGRGKVPSHGTRWRGQRWADREARVRHR